MIHARAPFEPIPTASTPLSDAPEDSPLAPRDAGRLARWAPAADAMGLLHPAQQAVIHHRGWLKMLSPRACGGAQWPLPRAVRLEEAIATVDGSCAWVVTLCAGAGWFAGFLPAALAREIIATHRLCVAGSGAPSGVAEREGTGYRLTGQWAHASGAPLATHFTMNAVLHEHGQPVRDEQGAPRIRAFVLPREAVHVLPTWHSIGLRATASNAFRIEGHKVPADHGFAIEPGAATVDGALYRFPFLPLALVTLAANLSGMAQHFLALASPLIERRASTMAASPDAARAGRDALHQAQHALAAARTVFYERLDHAWAIVERGEALTDSDSQAVEASAHALVDASRCAVDDLYPRCGLHAADPRSDINRVWRDLHTATQHALWWR